MTTNKLKLGLVVLGVLATVLVFPINSVLAVDEVKYTADTTVSLTGQDITILSGSDATEVIVNATNLDITVTNPDVFTVRSANKYTFTIGNATGTYLTSCGSTFSEVAIQPATGVTETNLTITPTTTVCSSVSGGAVGGGAGADTTAPTGTVSVNAGATTTNSQNVTLTLSASDNVGVTQMQISNDSVFTGATWEAYATSRAWVLTSGNGNKTVYARFRDAAANTSATATDSITLDSGATVVVVFPAGCTSTSGFSTTTGARCDGGAGTGSTTTTTTTTTTADLQAQITALTAQINAILIARGLPPLGTTKFVFTRNLTIGSTGEEVRQLQIFLNGNGAILVSVGAGAPGSETTYFGARTRAALARWQAANGVAPAVGYFGPITRARIHAM